MADTHFVIVLTQHRFLGNIFHPYLIGKEDKFYTTIKLVKPQDMINLDYTFKPFEKKLVELIDRYSDERLMKRFSRALNVSEFFTRLESPLFQKQVAPYMEKCMWEVARILMLSPVRLLNKEVKYTNLYDEDEIDVPPYFARPVFHFERTASETRYNLQVFLDNKELPLLNKKFTIVANMPCVLVYRKRLLVFEKLDSKKLTPFFSKEFVSIPRSLEDKYYTGFLRKAIRDYDVKAKGFQLLEGSEEKMAVLSLEQNLKYEPCLVLSFRYGNEQFLPNALREVAVHFEKNGDDILFKKIKRDKEWEEEVLHHLVLAGLTERDGFYLPKEGKFSGQDITIYDLVNWLNRNKPELEKGGITVEQEKTEKKYFTGEQRMEVKTGMSGDWFDVYATVTFGEFSFPFIKLKHHILNDIREFELPNGEIAIIPGEWLARYKSLMPFAKSTGEKMQFGRHHFALVAEALDTHKNAILEKIRKLSGFRGRYSCLKVLTLNFAVISCRE